jgi:hypothetical protein
MFATRSRIAASTSAMADSRSGRSPRGLGRITRGMGMLAFLDHIELDHTETPRQLRSAQPPARAAIAPRSDRACALQFAPPSPPPLASRAAATSARPVYGRPSRASTRPLSCFCGLDWHRPSLPMPIDSPRFDTRPARYHASDAATSASSDDRAMRIDAAASLPRRDAQFPHTGRRIRPAPRRLPPTHRETKSSDARKR